MLRKERIQNPQIKRFGTFSMAQSCLQPICDVYKHENGVISYLNQGNYGPFSTHAMVLAQPICAENQQKRLLTDFLQQHQDAAFVQVNEALAQLLKKQFNYHIIPFGVEHEIDLQQFSYNWRLRPNLIRYKNKFKRLDYHAHEIEFNENYQAKCKALSDQWLASKHIKTEQSFLTRPLHFEAEENVRVFALENQNHLICFLTLDPIYKNNKIIGYLINHLRYNPELPKGASYALIAAVIDQLKLEGVQILSLGIAPYQQKECQTSDLMYLKTFFDLIYSQNKVIYNFKGIQHMKESFKAQKSLRYLAFKSSFPIIDCVKLYQAFLFGRKI